MLSPTSPTLIFTQLLTASCSFAALVFAIAMLCEYFRGDKVMRAPILFALVALGAAITVKEVESNRLMDSPAKPTAILLLGHFVKGQPEDKLLAKLLVEKKLPSYRDLDKIWQAKSSRESYEAEGHDQLEQLRERAKRLTLSEGGHNDLSQ